MKSPNIVDAWLDRIESSLQRSSMTVGSFLALILAGAFLLGLMWARAISESTDGVTTSTGGRVGLFALIIVLGVGLSLRRLLLFNRAVLTIIPGLITATFVIVAGFLFATGRLDAAYALYGGLQVLRSDKLFSDSHWVLSWFECDFCPRWDPHYGPPLALLEPLTAGSIGLSWLYPVGIFFTLLTLLSIFVLARSSHPVGKWLLIAAAASPAWLLLVDRAHPDIAILAFCVGGLYLVSKRPGLLSWSLFATGLWVLGTIKYFPFAMGALLLLAIGVRHGWLVVVGFLTASLGYVAVVWDSYRRTSEFIANAVPILGDFPAYGRIQVLDLVVGLDASPPAQITVVGLLVLLVMAGSILGYGTTRPPEQTRIQLFVGSLAIAGAIAFLGKTLWAGFGFMYAGAFLLLAVPAIQTASRKHMLHNGMHAAAALLLLIAIYSAYNTLLATIAGSAFAGFALGSGLRIAQVVWLDRQRDGHEIVNKKRV